MKRKIGISILAIPFALIEFGKWLKVCVKNFPEIVTIPSGVILLCTYPLIMQYSGLNWLFEFFHDNPAEPNRSLKAFEIMIVAMIYVFLANAASYAAIKYNRIDLWEHYTDISRFETTDIHRQEIRFYWGCYFFGILAAIFLSHSLILI
jgi:hypothetical protein